MPISAEDFFKRTIEYVERLRFGEIPGTDPVHLDLKEVLHLLIIDEGDDISATTGLPGMFGIDDYMEQFGARDAEWRAEAEAAAAIRKAEAERMKSEGVAMAAEDEMAYALRDVERDQKPTDAAAKRRLFTKR